MFLTSTKTIAVTESVWERLKERMKREQARSLGEVVAKLLEETSGVPSSRFGVHRRLKAKFTQEEHEEITQDLH
jgi:predicted CopG family antitoxin